MKKSKIFAAALSAAMVMTAFTGCNNGPAAGGDDAKDGDTVKIGLNYELSGDVAQYGQACVQGIEMAVKELNAAGGVLGKQIELVKIDNRSEASEAKNVATRLADKEKVSAILGPATSGAVKSASAAATQSKVPLISCSSTTDDITNANGKVYDYIFRTCYTDTTQGSAMGNFAFDNLKAKKAVILSDTTSDYSKGLAAAFKKAFTAKGGSIVAEESFSSKDKEYSQILTKIKGQTFDVIYLPCYYTEGGLMIKQARALGINQTFLGADGYDDTQLVEIVGDKNQVSNIYFTNHYSSNNDTDPKVKAFVEAFKTANNGVAPNSFNALGYDMAKFVVDAIARANSAEPEKVKDALAATKDFQAVTGTFSMDSLHNPIKSTIIVEYKNGEQYLKDKIDPQ